MKTYILIVLFFSCFTESYSQSPFLHLNADNADTTLLTAFGRAKNDNIENGIANRSSMINYNPALDFDGEDDYIEYKGKIKDLSKATIFTVFLSQNDPIEEAEIWGMHGEDASLGLTTKRILSSKMETTYEGVVPESVILHVFTESNRSNSNGNLNSFLNLGVVEKDETNTYFKGSVAEVIAFDKRLRGKKRQIVESTLAIKYGILIMPAKNFKLLIRKPENQSR